MSITQTKPSFIKVGTNKYSYKFLDNIKWFYESYEEAARRWDKTNKGSEYCINCSYCTNCNGCNGCYHCDFCLYCDDCLNLLHCFGCYSCISCNDTSSLLKMYNNNEKLK